MVHGFVDRKCCLAVYKVTSDVLKFSGFTVFACSVYTCCILHVCCFVCIVVYFVCKLVDMVSLELFTLVLASYRCNLHSRIGRMGVIHSVYVCISAQISPGSHTVHWFETGGCKGFVCLFFYS